MAFEKFRKSTQRPVLSYNFQELVSAISIVSLDSLASRTSSATAYSNLPTGTGIMATPHYSTGATESTPTNVLVLTVNFDNAPAAVASILKGVAIVEATYLAASGNLSSTTAYIKVYVKRVAPDTTVTTVGSSQSTTTSAAGSNGFAIKTETIPITLTETVIRPGDVIRLTVEAYVSGTGAASGGNIAHILHDPANRDATTPTTITAADNHTYLKWHLPFKPSS